MPETNLTSIQKEILSHSNPDQAEFLSRFFKTGKGEYGEGDVFLGIRVPISRKLAKKYKTIDLNTTISLLHSPYHEMRLIALFVLADQFKNGNQTVPNEEKITSRKTINRNTKKPNLQKEIFQLYCKNIECVNNWDLVDDSAPKIPGLYLLDKNEKERSILYKWVKSKSLWERRISIVSTFAFIRNGDYNDTFRIAEILLNDKEDLIHKAVGWMIREIYKRDSRIADAFIQNHVSKMPRTTLRYAIEKYPEKERKEILNK